MMATIQGGIAKFERDLLSERMKAGVGAARALIPSRVKADSRGIPKDAARLGGVGLQIVRDWLMRFNASGPDGLIDGTAPGPHPKLNDARASGACGDRGERSDTVGPWRGAMAAPPPGPVA